MVDSSSETPNRTEPLNVFDFRNELVRDYKAILPPFVGDGSPLFGTLAAVAEEALRTCHFDPMSGLDLGGPTGAAEKGRGSLLRLHHELREPEGSRGAGSAFDTGVSAGVGGIGAGGVAGGKTER